MDARSVVEIVRDLAQQERALHHTTFLAPCVAGGEIQTRIAGLVRTFKPKPRNFEGWGLFRAVNERVAELVEDASLPLVGQYLSLLEPALRLCLAHQLRERTWLAYPANESDARQRWGEPRPLPVHLVTDGGQFVLGAEVGISTQKFHARGPMGLKELTSYKWVVVGKGQVRP